MISFAEFVISRPLMILLDSSEPGDLPALTESRGRLCNRTRDVTKGGKKGL